MLFVNSLSCAASCSNRWSKFLDCGLSSKASSRSKVVALIFHILDIFSKKTNPLACFQDWQWPCNVCVSLLLARLDSNSWSLFPNNFAWRYLTWRNSILPLSLLKLHRLNRGSSISPMFSSKGVFVIGSNSWRLPKPWRHDDSVCRVDRRNPNLNSKKGYLTTDDNYELLITTSLLLL